MDSNTFERIRDLRHQAGVLANDHEPSTEQEHNEATPEERFNALGKLVMNRDEFPIEIGFKGSNRYTVRAFLPDSVTVRLVADTLEDPTVVDLVTVRAEWSVGSIDNPLHVDSVSNLSGRHSVSEYTLRRLALVEESFAEAKQYIAS